MRMLKKLAIVVAVAVVGGSAWAADIGAAFVYDAPTTTDFANVAPRPLFRSGGTDVGLGDLVRLLNKKTVICSRKRLAANGSLDGISCTALVVSDDQSSARIAYIALPPAGFPGTRHLHVVPVVPADVLALVGAWEQAWREKGNWQAAGHRLSATVGLPQIVQDRMIGGSDYRSLRPVFSDVKSLGALERELDQALAADGGILMKEFRERSRGLMRLRAFSATR